MGNTSVVIGVAKRWIEADRLIEPTALLELNASVVMFVGLARRTTCQDRSKQNRRQHHECPPSHIREHRERHPLGFPHEATAS